jgi:hypothetical protein
VEADTMTGTERDTLLFMQLDRIEDTQGKLADKQGDLATSVALIEEKLTHRSDDPTIKGWIASGSGKPRKPVDWPKVLKNAIYIAGIIAGTVAGIASIVA